MCCGREKGFLLSIRVKEWLLSLAIMMSTGTKLRNRRIDS
jgi:hypothetical protein